MRKIKSIVLFVFLIIIMNCTLAYANVSTSAVNVEKQIKNSDTEVKIVRTIGQEEEIIYIGNLKGFANGLFSDIDFTNIEMAVFAVAGENEDEFLYVFPVESEYSVASMSLTNQTEDEIITNTAIVYDNTYYENVLLPGKTLSIPLTVKNTGESQKELVSYIAKYNLEGHLLELSFSGTITVGANQTVQTIISQDFSVNEICTAKVFVWDKESMSAVSDSIFIKSEIQDYYPDSYEAALSVDFEKELCGVINTQEDIDIVKFVPDETGIYALKLTADTSALCGLYNSSQSLLNSVSSQNNYLFYSLTAGQEYYIRFSGSQDSNYRIIPSLPDEFAALTKNTGEQNTLSDSNDYDVYKFTPSLSGNYIITAVDSFDVKAELYNSSFEKIAASETGDNNVSFRITSNMTANQEYYIVISSKNQAESTEYMIYVEEPFTLLSIS